ncbi:hypothetical protein H5410_055441 [Solanum commersonii]|uniref:SAM domain-containing protein n=1 Tax=Solanum commersonii TaxID=4109 RepID=A0A9J5WHK7_SOLCO|nr:hypothetical protein H5410_055441 [Solanum commersonii]
MDLMNRPVSFDFSSWKALIKTDSLELDVSLWLEEIKLDSYCQFFKENGVNGEYLEGMSIFTTKQILRGLLEGRSKSPATMVGPVLYLRSVYEDGQA